MAAKIDINLPSEIIGVINQFAGFTSAEEIRKKQSHKRDIECITIDKFALNVATRIVTNINKYAFDSKNVHYTCYYCSIELPQYTVFNEYEPNVTRMDAKIQYAIIKYIKYMIKGVHVGPYYKDDAIIIDYDGRSDDMVSDEEDQNTINLVIDWSIPKETTTIANVELKCSNKKSKCITC